MAQWTVRGDHNFGGTVDSVTAMYKLRVNGRGTVHSCYGQSRGTAFRGDHL